MLRDEAVVWEDRDGIVAKEERYEVTSEPWGVDCRACGLKPNVSKGLDDIF